MWAIERGLPWGQEGRKSMEEGTSEGKIKTLFFLLFINLTGNSLFKI